MTEARTRAARLGIWKGPVEPVALGGGITNVNFLVEDGPDKYVVRVGDDIPVHQVMRFNELAASRAAEAAGLSPQLVHHEPGILVLRYVEGRTLGESDIADQMILERILPLILRCHRDMPKHLRGPVLMFWVFHVIRDYAATLKEARSPHSGRIGELVATAEELEEAVGPIDLVFGHNDLLAANFIDEGSRIWLIDWDYAGFNSPLFDLGGLASNNGLSARQEDWLLEAYFDSRVTDGLRRRYAAMKAASLMRETMWSMVSEIHSRLDFDFAAYTEENMKRLDAALTGFREA